MLMLPMLPRFVWLAGLLAKLLQASTGVEMRCGDLRGSAGLIGASWSSALCFGSASPWLYPMLSLAG